MPFWGLSVHIWCILPIYRPVYCIAAYGEVAAPWRTSKGVSFRAIFIFSINGQLIPIIPCRFGGSQCISDAAVPVYMLKMQVSDGENCPMLPGPCTTFQVSDGVVQGIVAKGTAGRTRRYVLFGSPMCSFGVVSKHGWAYSPVYSHYKV